MSFNKLPEESKSPLDSLQVTYGIELSNKSN